MKHPQLPIALVLLSLSACLSVQDERGASEPAALAEPQVQEPVAPQPKAEADLPAPSTRPALRCSFEGQRHLNEKQLLAALEFELQAWLEGTSVEVVADDCAYQLVQHYRGMGFGDAQVTAKPNNSERDQHLSFTIDEGPQSLVTEFEFPGAGELAGLDPKALQRLYSDQKRPVWVQRDQAALADQITSLYRAAGFLDASAGPSRTVELHDLSTEFERSLRIVTPVNPGQRYMLTGVQHDLPEPLATEIGLQAALDEVQSGSGMPFKPHWTSQWMRAADNTLTRAGFLDARVQSSVKEDRASGQVHVQLTVEPGQRVRLRSIRYPADIKVRTSFLGRQIALKPGDTINSEAVDEALSRLYRTGLFRTVRLRVQGSGPERDLDVELEEWPTQETFIEPGYGSFERARLRIGWRHHNVLGVGRSLRVEGVLAENANRALVGFSDPWSLGRNWVLDVNTDMSQRKLQAFERSSNTVGAYASRNFGQFDRWTVHTGLRFEEIQLHDVRLNLLAGTDFEDDLSITTVEAGIAYDSRDHPLLPTRGQKGHFTVQQTVNASSAANAFAKVLSGWSYYHPISEHQVLSVGARIVAVFPKDGDPHPLGLRIFSGGDNSVRSFKESELGPRDSNGTATGGEAASTFSIELSQRLGSSPWQAAAFVDVGNVITNASALFEFDDLETALGVGVRYVLPIGPLRVDWAHNPNAKDFQDDWVLHFSLGVAF